MLSPDTDTFVLSPIKGIAKSYTSRVLAFVPSEFISTIKMIKLSFGEQWPAELHIIYWQLLSRLRVNENDKHAVEKKKKIFFGPKQSWYFPKTPDRTCSLTTKSSGLNKFQDAHTELYSFNLLENRLSLAKTSRAGCLLSIHSWEEFFLLLQLLNRILMHCVFSNTGRRCAPRILALIGISTVTIFSFDKCICSLTD